MINRKLLLALAGLLLVACGNSEHAHDEPGHDHGETAEAPEFERGPHNGRMLRDGAFALEITIFEQNVPPEFRLYAYENGKPIAPSEVQPVITLTRLDGRQDRFQFTPQQGFLRGDGEVTEPHSFDVQVQAVHAGKTHSWTFESYEGRVTIPAATAAEAGIRVQPVGEAAIRDLVNLVGTVVLNPDRHAHLKARFPGTVRAVRVQLGERVRRGQVLLVIEANESMREYTVTAPFDGIVLARETNIGDVTGDHALIEIADLSDVWVELHALGEQSTRIANGQPVRIVSATTRQAADTRVSGVLPLATRGQSVIIRARLDNSDGQWRPGMTVSASVVVSERLVPLAVRESALQRFRDFTVVFAQVGDTYEVRMLELGARDGEFAEVLSGIEPGTHYVTEQSFLIKADIEKSGASHDH
jgi:cobalt-zinc-cadmium efflux system membrane fusion protein